MRHLVEWIAANRNAHRNGRRRAASALLVLTLAISSPCRMDACSAGEVSPAAAARHPRLATVAKNVLIHLDRIAHYLRSADTEGRMLIVVRAVRDLQLLLREMSAVRGTPRADVALVDATSRLLDRFVQAVKRHPAAGRNHLAELLEALAATKNVTLSIVR